MEAPKLLGPPRRKKTPYEAAVKPEPADQPGTAAEWAQMYADRFHRKAAEAAPPEPAAKPTVDRPPAEPAPGMVPAMSDGMRAAMAQGQKMADLYNQVPTGPQPIPPEHPSAMAAQILMAPVANYLLTAHPAAIPPHLRPPGELGSFQQPWESPRAGGTGPYLPQTAQELEQQKLQPYATAMQDRTTPARTPSLPPDYHLDNEQLEKAYGMTDQEGIADPATPMDKGLKYPVGQTDSRATHERPQSDHGELTPFEVQALKLSENLRAAKAASGVDPDEY